MSSIVVSVINFVAGTILNKVCDFTARKFKDGDLTDEKCRELIVRELDDIKSKLDGLARKDLLSSASFLSDGVCLLSMSLEKSSDDEAVLTEAEHSGKITQTNASTTMGSEDCVCSESPAFADALTLSQATLSIASTKRYLSARSSFEKAYTKATEAFNNEALSTEDRILATKLRVISKILEYLDDPIAAAASCKLYLQQLHDMSAVQKIFAVYFRHKAGMKSRFMKTQRLRNVQLVLSINYALFDYIKIFTTTEMDHLFNWPKLTLAGKHLHPLLVENEMVKKLERSGLHPPNQYRFSVSECREECPQFVAVLSNGDIIINNKGSDCLDVINNKGEIQSSFSPIEVSTKPRLLEIVALGTDGQDNVYIVSRFKLQSSEFYYNISVVDPKGNIQRGFSLECLTGPGGSHHSVCIAVSKDGDIFVTKQDEARVCVFNCVGELKWTFVIEGWHLIKYLCVSNKNEIIAAELIGKAVVVCTKDGKFQRNIEIPGLHKVCGLAFNHATEAIIVLTEVMSGNLYNYQLESYSEHGEQLQTLLLPEKRTSGTYKLTSHSKGPFAVVHKTGVTFLQH